MDLFLTAQEQIGRYLATAALRGVFTLEDLDTCSPQLSSQQLEADRRAVNSRQQRIGRPPLFPPEREWRNLARDWIAAHPTEFQQLLQRSLEQEQPIDLPPPPSVLCPPLNGPGSAG